MGVLHEICSGQEIRVLYPDIAQTGGVGPCIAIGILDTKKRIGYLIHEYQLTTPGMENILLKEIRGAPCKEDLKVALAGNVPSDRESIEICGLDFDEYLKEVRAHSRVLLELLIANGVSSKNIQNFLVDHPALESFEMTIDTTTNEIIVIKEESYWEEE
ncbi:MAG: hypothetical protein KBD00_02835 [Candidatus Peribacteraceae bacterium]|nr:hypothetical protein [Candidatus Peribacteraceae bacterium]